MNVLKFLLIFFIPSLLGNALPEILVSPSVKELSEQVPEHSGPNFVDLLIENQKKFEQYFWEKSQGCEKKQEEKSLCWRQLERDLSFYVEKVFETRQEYLKFKHQEQLNHLQKVKTDFLQQLKQKIKV